MIKNNKTMSIEMIKEQQSKNQLIMDFYSDDHLRVNKSILSMYGIDIALWIADISSRWNYFRKRNTLDEEGFFFTTQREIRESSGLNFNKQTEIIKKLSEDKIIEIKRKGLPKTNHYKINILQLIKLINQSKIKVQEACNTKHKEIEIQSTRDLSDKPYNKNNGNKNNYNKKILSKDNIDCKSNLDDNFSNSDFNKDSLTRKIKRSLSEPEDYSKEVQSLFEFWQSLKIVNHKKSKSRNKALQDLDKTLQKYSEKEIKRSMQVYKDFLNDPYNRKTKDPPYKVGLNQFFGFDKFTKDNIKNFHKDLQEMKSWFDLCLHNEETLQKKFTRKTKDKDPVLTKNLTEVIQQKNGQTKLTNDQLDMCRKASNRILDLWAKKYRNKKDFNLMAKKYIMSFYRGYILPWIENTANKNIEKNFGVHWLLSEHFEDSIEEFIKNPHKT
jgi:hypothetical protein